MTAGFDRLQAGPQTEIDIAQLSADERMVVRQIQINGTVGVTASESVGGFTGVFYIEGDQKRAAERFVEENSNSLSQVDFSKRNPISTSVDREVYDWVLHALGERELKQYKTVVVERRPDGTVWCIGRRTFEERPMRRYTTSGTGSAKIEEITLEALYEAFGEQITESALLAEPQVSGDVREILDVFRQSPIFDCTATTSRDELAIRKRHSQE